MRAMAEGTREHEGGVAPDRESGRPAPGIRRTFVVSLVQDEAGGHHGVVELVRTGRKERFEGLAALGTVMAAMLRAANTSESWRDGTRYGA